MKKLIVLSAILTILVLTAKTEIDDVIYIDTAVCANMLYGKSECQWINRGKTFEIRALDGCNTLLEYQIWKIADFGWDDNSGIVKALFIYHNVLPAMGVKGYAYYELMWPIENIEMARPSDIEKAKPIKNYKCWFDK